MSVLIPYGHRSRAPYLDSDAAQSLAAGILVQQQPGKDWFVNSAASSGGNGATPQSAVLTVALAQALAASGDRVHILSGHSETISAAGGITFSKAGVQYFGYGHGGTRPLFTFSATTSTMLFTAADVLLSNVRMTCSIDEVVLCVGVRAARVTLDRVDYFETAAMTPITWLVTTADGVDMTIQGCRHYQATASAAANGSWITLTGADRARILDCTFFITLPNGASSSIIDSVTTASLNVDISRCKLCQLGGTTQDNIIDLMSGCTGYVTDTRCAGDVGTLAASIDLASAFASEVYSGTTVNKNGILDPVVA